jgi:hypothetical protein
LAKEALDKWERDTSGGALSSPESPEQWPIRDRAATLSLIGLSIQEDGVEDGEDVVVDLDAWFIGHALDAAEEDDLLSDVRPPRV